MSEFVQPGSKAPDFRLLDSGNEWRTLADFAGRWLALYFYPKDNTSGCTTEALEFTALLPRFRELNAEVAGVSKDSATSHANFIEKHNLDVILLSDPTTETLAAYGAWRLKKMYGKESMGVVRSTALIDPEGVVRAVWPKVAKGAGHAEKVLQALQDFSK